MSLLADSSMLVSVTVRCWEGRKLDRTVSNEVISTKHAKSGAARVNKQLIPKYALEAIQTARGGIRSFLYSHTLPWSTEGSRILPSRGFFDFDQGMQDRIADFDAAVEAFLAEYPAHMRAGMDALGDMAQQSEYPSADQLRRRFCATIDYFPIGDPSDDWRLRLSEEQMQRVRDRAQQCEREAIESATREVWDRIEKPIRHITETLRQYSTGDRKRFNDSLIGNLRDLVPIMRGLNFSEDRHIERILDRVEHELCPIEPNTLRASPAVREHTASAADDILRDLGMATDQAA